MKNTLLSQVTAIVREAGSLILSIESFDEIKSKEGSANYVTKYDSLVQDFLMEKLSALIPDASFLGEENGYSEQTVGEGYTFIIDPIDGTTNFICGFMESGICVGLALDRTMVLGVVYNPFRDEMFYGERGNGSYLNGKPLHIQNRGLAEGVINFGTAPYNPELREDTFSLAKAVSYHTMDIREIGAASLGICYVACGRCVAYSSPRLCTWDYAAASVILEEAGGRITKFDGMPLHFLSKTPVVAAPPKALGEFIQIVKDNKYPLA